MFFYSTLVSKLALIIGVAVGVAVFIVLGCCIVYIAKRKKTPTGAAGVGMPMTGTTSASHGTQPGVIQLPPPNPIQQPAVNPYAPPPVGVFLRFAIYTIQHPSTIKTATPTATPIINTDLEAKVE